MISEAQATTGCTEGNCKGGTGTYVYPSGTIEKGQFDTDEYLLVGTRTYTDGSYIEINFKSNTSEGTLIYTNANGFRFPSMIGLYIDDGSLKPKINNKENWNDAFDKWKSEQQCVANYKGVRLNKFGEDSLNFVFDKPDGSQYIFYDNNRIIIFDKDGKILKRGDYKC